MTNHIHDASTDASANRKPLSKAHIHDGEIEAHLQHITREFKEGFEFLEKYPKSVSIFGSSLAKGETKHYHHAEELGSRIVKELKYAVITGAGPGIMEAANKGAAEAGGVSLGLGISLPHERFVNAYVKEPLHFSYFFARKTMLSFAAEAYVFFPGGYGTFDELFSILTLVQTGKIPRVPIVLFDSGYWTDLVAFFTKTMVGSYGAISPDDLRLFEVTDSLDRTMEIIKGAQVSEWWRNIN